MSDKGTWMEKGQKGSVEHQPTLDRESEVPLYVQLKRVLEEGIESGRYRPGQQLPGEPELCRRFNVSRTVVRQALKEMSYEGRISREKGRGTFVAEPKIASRSLVHSLSGFYEDMLDRGSPPVDEVLEREILPARARVARYLEIPELEPVHKITRLRFVEGEPIVLVTSYLPYEVCRELAEADLVDQSLYAFLRETCGITIARGRRRIEAIVADEYEAKLLKVERGFPLLKMDSVSYAQSGEPVEYFQGLFRSDRTTFDVEILNLPLPEGTEGLGLTSEEDFWVP